jgi:hypothetical protein
VVVDDRHDLYGEAFLRSYLKIIHAEPGWQQALADRHITWVLIPANSTLASGLDGRPEWTSVYRDDTAGLYQLQGN